MPLYGQVVVGPPGSGKTTYCDGMQQYLRLLGREALVVNLDPANESIPAPPSSPSLSPVINVRDERQQQQQQCQEQSQSHTLPYDTLLDVCQDIVNLSSVMDQLHLGPNGGLMYCMEYIERHLDHVVELIQSRLIEKQQVSQKNGLSSLLYLIFDLPGQVELYTHNSCVHNILHGIIKGLSLSSSSSSSLSKSQKWDLRLCAVQLIDATFCYDTTKFISSAVMGLATMIRLELPIVNVLSKVDLLGSYSSSDGGGGDSGDGSTMAFNFDFFLQGRELYRLVDYLDSDPLNPNDGTIHHHSDDHNTDNDCYADDMEYKAARQRTRSSKFYKRYHKLHEVLCEVIEDYGLLSYVPLSIQDAESVGRVVARIDKANGYVFVCEQSNGEGGANDVFLKKQSRRQEEEGGGEGKNEAIKVHDMFQCAIEAEGVGWQYESISDVQERFLGGTTFPESIPELERRQQQQQQQER